MNNKRLASIDTLRFLAIWGVLIIHGQYFFGWSYKHTIGWVQIPAWLMSKTTSFSVPLFFIVSGYLFGKAYLKEKNITDVYFKHIQRLLIVFIGWSIIYSLLWYSIDAIHHWSHVKQYGFIRTYYWYIHDNYLGNPVLLLFVGTAAHLWFVSALIQSLTLISFLIILKQESLLIYLGLLIYFLTPFATLYIHPPTGGEYTIDWNPYIGIFYAIPPIIMGWHLSIGNKLQYPLSYLLLIIGILLAIGQFAHIFDSRYLEYFNISSLLIPLSLVMLALLNTKWSANTIFPHLGQMTLGIYCVHTLVMYYLGNFSFCKNQFIWAIPLLLITYLSSFIIVLILKNIPLTKKLVV